jgi:hypothetical protein
MSGSAKDVIQAPKPEPRIMPYELSDFEWTAIKPMLPNKMRGVRRVNDRRVLNGIFWMLRSGVCPTVLSIQNLRRGMKLLLTHGQSATGRRRATPKERYTFACLATPKFMQHQNNDIFS